MWAIRGTLDRRLYVLIAVSSFALWLVAWWAVTALQLVDPLFLPGREAAVLRRFIQWLRHGDLLQDAGISTFRVMAGFLASAVMALPLGLIIGAYRPMRAFFEPLLEFARYLPAVAFVPVVLLWTGIGEASKISVIWIGTFFQMVIMLSEDVARVPMPQVETARTLGPQGGKWWDSCCCARRCPRCSTRCGSRWVGRGLILSSLSWWPPTAASAMPY